MARVQRFFTMSGIKEVNKDMVVIPNEQMFVDSDSGCHYDYIVKNVSRGTSYKLVACKSHHTNVLVQDTFKGVTYKGKVQTSNDRWNVIVEAEHPFDREIQVACLQCKAIVRKSGNSYRFTGISLQVVKKLEQVFGSKSTLTIENSEKLQNGTYVCTYETYVRPDWLK